MTDIIARLRSKSPYLSGSSAECVMEDAAVEIERLRAVVVRAKDALIDGQSTQWVHDLLVAALLEPKP